METGSAGPCPACDGGDLRRIFVKSGRDFGRCAACDLERQFPLPSAEDLRAYYEHHYGDDGRLRDMFDAEAMLAMRARYRFAEVRPLLAAGRWLDVGASGGIFVATARAAGIDAEGIEVASGAVEQARALGRPVTRATIEEHAAAFGERPPYDAMTAFDVLEHVRDPRGFLAAARQLLRADGTFALSVPNQRALSRRMMGRHWYFYIPDGHLFTFNARNLRMLLERSGFEMVKHTVTMKPITYRYALTQLRVLNTWLAGALKPLDAMLPARWADAPIPLPLGEILVLARRRS